MISYKVKYFPGNLNVNQTASFLAEIMANFAIGFLLSKFRPKYVFSLLYLLSSIAGVLIIIIGDSTSGAFVFLVLLAKFGVSAVFNGLYIAHPNMFPTLFSVTSMGIVNFVSRFATIFAPMIAEVTYPIPMTTFTTLCVASAILALFLIEK